MGAEAKARRPREPVSAKAAPRRSDFSVLDRRAILGFHADPYPNPSSLSLTPAPASLREVVREWEEFLRQPPFGQEMVLHVHVPYCRSKCHFCDCSSSPPASSQDFDVYLEHLQAEIGTLAPLFREVRFQRLYIGGGTPNLLSDTRLASLFQMVNRHFETAPGAVRCIEFAPERTRPSNLGIARDAGINRVSLGIQTLSPGILPSLGRPGAFPETSLRALDLVHRAGFPEVNVDLIFGLGAETPEDFHRGLASLLSQEPDTVTIQLVHDSKISQVFSDRQHRHLVEERYVRYVRDLLGSIEDAFPDYRGHLRPGVCVLVHRKLARPWDQWLDFFSCLDRDFVSTLGLGPMAHSRLLGRLGYQCQFGARDPSEQNYVFHWYTVELEAFIEAACSLAVQGRIRLDELRTGPDKVPPSLARALERLEQEGLLSRDGVEWRETTESANPLMPEVQRLAEACRRTRLGEFGQRRRSG